MWLYTACEPSLGIGWQRQEGLEFEASRTTDQRKALLWEFIIIGFYLYTLCSENKINRGKKIKPNSYPPKRQTPNDAPAMCTASEGLGFEHHFPTEGTRNPWQSLFSVLWQGKQENLRNTLPWFLILALPGGLYNSGIFNILCIGFPIYKMGLSRIVWSHRIVGGLNMLIYVKCF